jgi:tetratricopeptide (TPR) repeat protein
MRTARTNATSLIKLLAQCTVQIWIDHHFCGTGFFLAPGIVATCSHVVAPAAGQVERIAVHWNGGSYKVEKMQCEPLIPECPDPYPYPDTAMLKTAIAGHPWVDCDASEPILFPEPDHLYANGWSLEFSRDLPRLTPIALSLEGELFDLNPNEDWRLQLREGRISGGISGAPVLNFRTGKICAMITRTRDAMRDGGGWAVPLARHFDRFCDILDLPCIPICETWNQARHTEFFQRFSGVIRPAHRPVPPRTDLPPSFLLRTEYAVVPFIGRQDETDDLVTWCESGEQSSARLLVGPAGAGKTRLAAQLCQEMSRRGWTTGFLSPNCKPESFDQLRETGSPLLAVFDYSDAWLGLEQFLIRLDAPEETAPPTRIMLLARQTGAWWHRLASANPYVAIETTRIGAATASPEELQTAYLKSAEAFRKHLGTASIGPDEPIPPLAGQPMLVVHMAALLRVDTQGDQQRLPKDQTPQSQSSEIISSILDHEEAYWQRSVIAAGQKATRVLLRRAVALASLFGWAHEMGLAQLLTAIPDLADASSERRHELARWIMAFYPVDDPMHQGILQPDVLIERLVILALVDCPQLLTALSFAAPDNADRAFAIIDRACSESNDLRWTLERVLRSDLHRLGPIVLRIGERSEGPLRDEFIRALRATEIDFQTLDEFLSAVPAQSVHLHKVAIAICQRAVELARRAGDALLVATMLERFASRLSEVGQNKEALEQSLEALDLILRDAQGEETTLAVPLVAQLLVVARRLITIRETAKAITYLDHARHLAEDVLPDNPSLHGPQLSYVLGELTAIRVTLGNDGEIADSVQAEWNFFSLIGCLKTPASNALLATQFLRRVRAFQSYVPRLDLLAGISRAHQAAIEAAALTDEPLIAELQGWRELAQAYRSLDCAEEELSAAQKAEDICRGLMAVDPLRYGADLANMLAFRADHVGGDHEVAIDFLKEVVAIRRRILSQTPSRANSSALARALLGLGQRLSSTGYREGAIQVTEEAVDVFRQLAERFGGNEYLNLGGALHELMISMSKGRTAHRAATAAMERVAISRRLAAVDFIRYGRDLVIALSDSMDAYAAAGMKSRLDAAAHEVVRLCRRMQERADRLNVDMSKVLAGAGLALARAGAFDDAVILLSNVVDVRRERVSKGNLGEYAPELINALGYLADTLMIIGQWRSALTAADEAYAICGRLLTETPRDRLHNKRRSDTEQFYACLVRLYHNLQMVTRDQDAARIRAEGLEVLELLASQGNLAAMDLVHRDFPKHSPHTGIRKPRRPI